MGLLGDISAWIDNRKRVIGRTNADLMDNPGGLLGQWGAQAQEDLKPQGQGLLGGSVMPEVQQQAAQDAIARWMQLAPIGHTVYHGSPHTFDKFDASKIGTGEGAQAYGHGVYVAESPDVARSYQNTLSKYGQLRFADGTAVQVEDLPYGSAQQIAGQLWMRNPNYADAKYALGNLDSKHLGAAKDDVVKELDKLRARGASLSGQFYKVDLPDEWLPKMLDWDKPLPMDHPVRGKLREAATQKLEREQYGRERSQAFDAIVAAGNENLTGQGLYQQLARTISKPGAFPEIRIPDPVAAAREAQAAGIPGIRYLDGGSRSAGEGSYNYVVFPGMEGLLKILERQ